MKKPFLFAALAVIAVGGVMLMQSPATSQLATNVEVPYQDKEAVARGEGVYTQFCASCHGADRQGQPDWRKRNAAGRLPAPPHDESGHTWHHSDDMLFNMVKFGVGVYTPDDYQSDMPEYQPILSDDQILDVLAYLKSQWSEKTIQIHNKINKK